MSVDSLSNTYYMPVMLLYTLPYYNYYILSNIPVDNPWKAVDNMLISLLITSWLLTLTKTIHGCCG